MAALPVLTPEEIEALPAENWRQESAMRRKVRMEAWLPGEMIRRGQLEEIYP